MSIYKKKQGRFAGKIPAVQGIFHTERQGSPNLQKQEKSNEKIKDNSVCHGTDAVTDSAGTGKGRNGSP